MTLALLVVAILIETVGTVALKRGGQTSRAWYVLTGCCMVTSLSLLSVALHLGLPIGVAYGIWAASGVALTAVVSRVVFDEPLTRLMGVGIGLISLGVLIIEVG